MLPATGDPQEIAVRCRFSQTPELSIVVDTVIGKSLYGEKLLVGNTYVFNLRRQKWEVKTDRNGRKCFSRTANIFRGYGVDPTIQCLDGIAAESSQHSVVLEGGETFVLLKNASPLVKSRVPAVRKRSENFSFSDSEEAIVLGDVCLSLKKLSSNKIQKVEGLKTVPTDSHICFASRELNIQCDSEWRMFDFSGRKIGEIPKDYNFNYGVMSLTADGKFILAGARGPDGQLLVFQRNAWGIKKLYERYFGKYFQDYPVGPYKIETSPEGDTAALIIDDFHKAYGGLFLMDIKTGNIRPFLGVHRVQRVFFLNSKIIVVCFSNSLKLFDVETGQELGRWDSMEDEPPFEQEKFGEKRWAIDRKNNRIFYLTLDDTIQAIDVSVLSAPQTAFSVFLAPEGHWVVISPAQEYMGEKEAISLIHFVGGFQKVRAGSVCGANQTGF